MSTIEIKFEERILSYFEGIELSPYRFLLDTGNFRATVPMIRGVWGSALKNLDKRTYSRVFEGVGTNAQQGMVKTPLYIFSPTPPDPKFSPAVHWTIIGQANFFENTLIRALHIASQMGLGPNRVPFSIPKIVWLNKQAKVSNTKQCWNLRESTEELHQKFSSNTPIQLKFLSPLRLIRDKKLIEKPTFTDITIAIIRRIFALSKNTLGTDLKDLVKEIIKIASDTPSTVWTGKRTDFVRWSGSQTREIDMHGVSGVIELPQGAGELWPLIIAGYWLHIGKGTVFGLGKLTVDI